MKTRITCLLFIALVILLPVIPAQAQASPSSTVLVLTSEGSLTPILADYLERGITSAVSQNAQFVILELNTPGGSIELMNSIVQKMRTSPVPVVVYVTPRGSMAASAGAIITLGAHLSAMAPETTIGAASPVGSQGEDIGETMESKVKEVLKADARNLTQRRSPEAIRLAEQMIEDARAVTVDEAYQIGLVDIRASDLDDLLTQLDGRKAVLPSGEVTLNTRNITVERLPKTFIENALQMLVNPNLVFLLLSLGIQAVLIELSTPGGWIAGFTGIVCILLAVYGMGFMPVNWFGLLFILMAFVLFILEIKAPTHGALTAAGAATFAAGALILFNSNAGPGMPRVSIPLVIGTAIFTAALFFAVMFVALRAQRKPILIGAELLPDQTGLAITEINPRGMVHIAGEQWSAELAEGEAPIPVDARVQIVKMRGLVAVVRRI